MNIDVRHLDISQSLLNTPQDADGSFTPTAIVRRDGDTTIAWHILQNQIPQTTKDYSWSESKLGEVIRIPMFEYLMNDDSPEKLVRFGTQIGIVFYRLILNRIGNRSIDSILVLTSDVFGRRDNQPGCTIYVGVAAKEAKGAA